MMFSGRYETARPAFIPHDERLPRHLLDPADNLPVPKCLDCGALIFYERGGWAHRDDALDDHPAQPDEAP